VGPSVREGPTPSERLEERTPVKQKSRQKLTLKSEQGQSLTEFALALPLLALLLFAVIQFGIVFNNYVTLTDATRAGARKGAVGRQLSNPSGAATTAVRSSAVDLKQSDLNVTVTSSWLSGSDVTVSATYPYKISLLGIVMKSGRLSSSTTERVE
jgi:Flp pilus assembly protein TadG